MRKMLAFCCVLTFLAAGHLAQARAVTAPAGLHISGNHFVAANQMVVHLQGATLSGLEYRCSLGGRYTPADFAAMRVWRMNVVKIPVNPHYYASLGSQSCDGTQNAQWAYHRAVQAAVTNAESQGLYVILVILDYNRSIHGGNPTPDHYTEWTLADLGTLYHADGSILLETFSEPHDISNATWRSGVQAQIDTINRVAPQTIILIDGPNWSGVPGLAYTAGFRPHGQNLAYAAHIYDQVSNATPANWPKDFATLALTYPVVATEFGDVSHQCGTAWLNQLMPYLAAHTAGWLFWAWDVGSNCERPDTLDSWAGTPNAYGAAIRAFYLRPVRFSTAAVAASVPWVPPAGQAGL